MPNDYLHNHREFDDLINIVANKKDIEPALVEKDYWIMHCLYGLRQLNLGFELKGGTSLSKGYKIINRFSEDIDIRIEPPEFLQVKTGRNHDKPAHLQSRLNFYNWLVDHIQIDGIVTVERDEAFDDKKYRNGGIRLHYRTNLENLSSLKEGILLEVGFDDVQPNELKNISSWAYDYAKEKTLDFINNMAMNIPCYNPGYTFVEKLQTISTKYRQQQKNNVFPINFMRHYYDVYHLLQQEAIQSFIQSPEYEQHKKKRFRKEDNLVINENEAFLLNNERDFKAYNEAYQRTHSLYYSKYPDFSEIMSFIRREAAKL